ncbi:TPA: hypothetical protein QCH98_004575 [Enterobacter bugandensis]|nr:hypothetical protein [Enterobacter bugandensis]
MSTFTFGNDRTMDFGPRKQKSQLYCYEIDGKIFFYPDSMTLLNFCGEKVIRIQLRPTMSSFLNFLLENGMKGLITEDEILAEVWEKNGLQGSTHRLWQVSRDLNYKLFALGLNRSLFEKISRKRLYSVNSDIVVPLYVNKGEHSENVKEEQTDNFYPKKNNRIDHFFS